MRYLIVFLIFIYSSMVHASGGMWPVPGKYYTAPVVGVEPPTLYLNMDSLSTTPTIGTGPLVIDSGILLNTSTPIVGAGSWDNDNNGFDDITIPATNIDYDNATIGILFRPHENATGRLFRSANDSFIVQSASTGNIGMNYKDKSQAVAHNMTTDGSAIYHIKVVLGDSTARLYINDVLRITLSAASGTITGDLKLGAIDGNQWDAEYDQLMIWNSVTIDAYALRNEVSFE